MKIESVINHFVADLAQCTTMTDSYPILGNILNRKYKLYDVDIWNSYDSAIWSDFEARISILL